MLCNWYRRKHSRRRAIGNPRLGQTIYAKDELNEVKPRTSTSASIGAQAMTEILFIVEEAEEGGYVAHAVGASIVTEAEDLAQLRTMVREAVRCHYDEDDAERPKAIRLHLVHDEVIAA